MTTTLRWRDLPWARKLGAVMLGLAILPLAFVTVFNEASARRAFVAESRTRNLQQADNTAALLARYLEDLLGDIRALALTPLTAHVLSAPNEVAAAADLRVTLDAIRSTKQIEMLQVLDHAGTVVVSTEPSFAGTSRVSAPAFLSAIAGQERVQDPRYQSDDGAVHISVSVPVRSAAGRIIGVALGRVSLEDIDRLIGADTNFGSLAEFGLLFDEHGIVLSSPAQPERRFHPLAPLDPVMRGRLIAEAQYGPNTDRWLDAPADAAALLERARWRLYDATADPNVEIALGGDRLQVTSVPVPGTRWTYAVATPERQAFAAVRRQTLRNFGVAAATGLFALLVAASLARWLSRPLRRMQDSARAIADGDLSRRADIEGRDEVGQLAAAFDSMADTLAAKDAELRRHAESLERGVAERTAELRGLLHAVPDLIFKISSDGRLLDVVAAKDEELALPPHQFLGRPLAEVMPPVVADTALDRIGRALAGEQVEPFEYALPIGGTERQYEARISASGPEAVIALVRDVTDRRRNEERTRFLAHAAERFALSLDYDSTVETVARLGVPFLADLCLVDLVDHGHLRLGAVAATDADVERTVAAIREKYPLGTDAQHPSVAAMKHGARLLPEVSVDTFTSVLQSDEHRALVAAVAPRSLMVLPLVARGQILGAIQFIRRDERRRYTEADLALAGELADRASIAIDNARLYRDLQDSNRLKDEFLGTVSHELRTPLNAVLGWTLLLRKGIADSAQAARALDAIERNARAQTQLVEDLLDTSRVVSGKLRIELVATDIGAVVHGAVESLGPLARGHGLDLRAHVATGLPPVMADAARLQQVIGNLIANSVKFTPSGGRITVDAAQNGATVTISVADTGAGIAPEFLPFVFDRFRQADSTTTRAHGGLGLGLAIARHLVELHGGAIRADSPGAHRGATFTVVLPIAAARPSPAGTRSDAPSIAGIRVLAVDDQEDARLLLRALLGEAGATVEVAASAGAALSVIERARPDVLVADIAMPAADGYTLIRAIRDLESMRRQPRLPAIALTAYAREEDRRRAEAAGFDRHLSKPLDAVALVAAIAGLLPRRARAI